VYGKKPRDCNAPWLAGVFKIGLMPLGRDMRLLKDGSNQPLADSQGESRERPLLGLSRRWRTAPPRSAMHRTPAIG
jgi:hypothetical protein